MDPLERKKIAAIEGQLLADKPWQLKGEVGAHSRPLNSLLFEDVNYEQRIKAPIITAESTEALEELIKQRIKDNKFDDPEKKTKPISTTTSSGTRQVEVSAEKSKVGLADLYEQELVAKTTAGKARDGPEKEVEAKVYALFRKLDAFVDR